MCSFLRHCGSIGFVRFRRSCSTLDGRTITSSEQAFHRRSKDDGQNLQGGNFDAVGEGEIACHTLQCDEDQHRPQPRCPRREVHMTRVDISAMTSARDIAAAWWSGPVKKANRPSAEVTARTVGTLVPEPWLGTPEEPVLC